MMSDPTQELAAAEKNAGAAISPYARLMEKAIESGGVEQLEKLMALQERYDQAQAKKAFYAALAAFQSELPTITKNGKASFYSRNADCQIEYTFAKLDDIVDAIKTPLSKHGLSYRFEQNQALNGNTLQMQVKCVVTHQAGHSESTEMLGWPDTSGTKNPLQALGSTDTYLRRYTLTGALGIVSGDEDDDGGVSSQPATSDTTSQGNTAYSDEQFEAFFDSWKERIQTGKQTAAGIIKFLGNKNLALTPAQTQKLQAVKPITNN